MVCIACGKEIPEGAAVCPECGAAQPKTKFCKHCGARIDEECVICPKCGKQVEEIKGAQPQVVINNSNQSTNTNVNTNKVSGGAGGGKQCNKWVALVLCLLLGFVGAHKFYEGKAGMGILYLFTGALFGVGWIIDLIAILAKPNPYYV